MDKESRVSKMEKWLEELNEEVTSLFHHLDLFKKLMDMIDRNLRLKSMDKTALSWMKISFVVDLVIGISRICDTTKGTESLVKFLENLKRNNRLLTRAKYISLYNKSSLDNKNDIANRDFDNLAGKNSNEYSQELIDEDIKRLTKKENPCKKIVDFRNQYIGHIAQKKDSIPSYEDLFGAFEVIEGILKRYNLLLKAEAHISFTPTIQGNWQQVFTIPWVETAE